jgi:uncharacterized repeat protein (TIGR01451 family)
MTFAVALAGQGLHLSVPGRPVPVAHAAPLLQAPANDGFDNSFVIPALPYTNFQNTTAATRNVDDPLLSCAWGGPHIHNHSVWYHFTASSSGDLHVDTNGSNYDTVLAVWTGSRGSLNEQACDDDSGSGLQSSLDMAVTAGTTYYIEVASYRDTAGGSLTLYVDTVAGGANDDFDNAFIISTTPYTFTQSTAVATTALDDPLLSCGWGGPHIHSHSVWYRFTPVSNGYLHADTVGSGYDTVLAVWTGSRGSLNEEACDDDSGSGTQSSLDLTVIAGTAYYVEITSYRNTFGGFLTLHASFIPTPPATMEVGIVSGIDETWTTVNLTNTYVSMVVVCTPNYANNLIPLVTRVRNVSGSSFEVRLQNPHGGNPDVALNSETVHYLVMEEGAFTLPDGRQIEAQKYDSTVTDRRGSWDGQLQSYLHTYANPVVLGQVMSYNDLDWSVFWDQGNQRQNPPNATVLRTGKTVCEDNVDTTRADETVGFVVIEQGNGTIGSVAYEARLGADTVRGVGNAPPYDYNFSQPFGSIPEVAIVSQAAMDDNGGGWAILYGANPLSASRIYLAIDEDQIRDAERAHGTEQVAYLVFGEPLVLKPYDLAISKTASSNPVLAGTTLTYTLTYTNLSFANAQNVTVTDTLPADVTFGAVVSAEPPINLIGTLPPAWYTPTLMAGVSGTIVFTVTVNAGASGTIINSAVITSSMPDGNPSNNSDDELTDVIALAATVQFGSATYSVGESVGSAVITVTLNAASGLTVMVDYATSDGTAIAISDYTTTSGTLTFPPGIITQTFTVPITSDAMDENDETVSLTLSNPVNAIITGTNPVTLTILDDDAPLEVQFSSASYSTNEGAGLATITAALNTASSLTVTVDYATSDGTAIAGNDYTAASGTLTFPPGITTQTFPVTIASDAMDENDETVSLTLSNPTNATLGGANPATLTIVDDDTVPLVRFSNGSYSVVEGAGPATVNVVLETISGLTVTVDYATSSGGVNPATPGADYTAASGTLTFLPGVTDQSFTVSINNNAANEPDETVLLTLSNPSNATVGGTNPATLIIVDDDSVTGQVTIDKAVSPSVVDTPGQLMTHTYVITISNAGPSTIQIEQIADTLPAGFVYITATTVTGGIRTPDSILVSGSDVTWSYNPPRPSISAGSNAILTFRAASSNGSGTYCNSASVTIRGSIGVVARGNLACVDVTWPVYQIESRVGDVTIVARVRMEPGGPVILSWEILP